MVLRRPLVVLDDGKRGELPIGDELPGGGGTTSGGSLPICLSDGTTIVNLPTSGGALPVCLADGVTVVNLGLV